MKKKVRRSLWSKIKIGLILGGSVLAFLVVGAAVVANKELGEAEDKLPDLGANMQKFDREPSKIFSDDGVVLYRENPERRVFVTGKDIPTMVILATQAAEDKRFMEHDGVDVWAMGRILAIAASTGHASQGGSTLTMQIAKNATGDKGRTFDRKLRQMAMATVIERHMSKEQIMEFYLNQSFYGQGAYGVAAAAEVYFNKKLNELSIGEMATLARCVRSPTKENPITNPEKAKFNRDVVLGVMREEGYITEEQYQHAVKEDLVLRTTKIPNLKSPKKEGYFVDFVLSELKRELPDLDFSSGGYRVETTLDTKMQDKVEEMLRERIHGYRGSNVNIGAFLCIDNEGRIQVMANSREYGTEPGQSVYNVPARAFLQPGSSFKPFVYSTAFELGVLDPGGEISNNAYYIRDRGRRAIRSSGPSGEVSIRSALAHSYNNAAMNAEKLAGLENVMSTSKNAFGFDHLKPNIETTALGSNTVTMLEMAEAYSVFQQRGSRVKPYAIKRVIGPDGLVVKSFQPEIEPRVVGSTTAQGMDRLLRAVVEEGTGAAASVVENARGKTGTTSDNKDAWFCGYTNRFVGIVWLANESRVKDKDGNERVVRKEMDDVDGKKYAAPTWAKLVGAVVERYGDIPLDPSDPMVQARQAERSSERGDRDVDSPVDDRVFDPIPEPRGSGDSSGPSAPPDRPVKDPEPVVPKRALPADGEPGAEPETDGPGNQVYVTICADTGQLATSSCPNRMRLPFERGTQPRTRCQLHGG
ncbi:MAG: transglycosylase domain-containing protein [Armatimonadota bacterium]